MRSSNEHRNELENTSYRELRLLEEVDSKPEVSQRQLARNLGVALGVANLLVRTMAKKGYIRMTHLSWKRWVYTVTPQGMARKVQLTLGYVERFIQHYRRVRALLKEDISSLPLNKESRVAIVGTSEIAELAYLALKDVGVDDVEVFDLSPTGLSFLGMPVQDVDKIEPGDYAKIVIAGSTDSAAPREELRALGVPDAQILDLLNSRGNEAGAERQRGVSP